MLEELRKKPKAAKERYAFLGATVITGVLALFWVLSLSVRFDDTEAAPAVAETPGAFSQFYSDAKANVAQVISTAKSRKEGSENTLPATTSAPQAPASSSVEATIQETFDAFRFPEEVKTPALIETVSEQSSTDTPQR